MGFLGKLLTLPVSGPVGGAFWVARKIHEAADAEVNDPAAIRKQLIALEADLDAGRIDEQRFEEIELVLLERLQAARDRQGPR